MDKLTLSLYLRKVEATDETKAKYRQRYKEVQGKIVSRWYYVKATHKIVAQVKIPSEKTSMMYDVLIEFPFGKSDGTYRDFRNDEIRVFSNCPSFVYMNARVFERKGFLINWAKDLYNKETLAPPPKDKEEEELTKDVKYEKSLYFAAIYLCSLNAIQVLKFIHDAMTMPNNDIIIKFIRSSDWAMEKRGKEYQAELKKKEKIRAADKGSVKVSGKDKPLISHIKKVSHTSKTSKVNRSKKIKHI